jgi:hypothetical protein
LALFLASFANLGLAQSTPQQVKGTTAQGTPWEALTDNAPAVAVSTTTRYVAWKSDTSQKIMFSAFNGTAWTTPTVVSGTTNTGSTWTAESLSPPALAVDDTTGILWLAWTNASSPNKVYVSTLNGTAWTNRQVVGGSNWTAESSKYAVPALSGGHGISLAWEGHSTDDIWYTNWNYPGWSTQHTVSGSGWAAQTDAGPGWTQTELVPGLGSISTLFWTDLSGDIFMSNDFPFGWTGEVTVACDSWTAQTQITFAPAAAYFNVNGNIMAAVFWVGPLQYSYTTGNGCGFAEPATITDDGITFLPPAVSVGSTLSILAWTEAINSHSPNNTIWYIDPTTLPGLN